MNKFQKVLIAYDGSANAKAALGFALELAMDSNAKLTALWVRPPTPFCSDLISEVIFASDSARECFQELSADIAEMTCEKYFDLKLICRLGNPARTILQYAKEGRFDLTWRHGQSRRGQSRLQHAYSLSGFRKFPTSTHHKSS